MACIFEATPRITLCTPQAVETYRAKSCTPSTMNKWYSDFDQFLLIHDLVDKPYRIWNCDESGVSLCSRSGKILAVYGVKTVYYTSSGKGQITCIGAAGGIIPPMHVFPGIRFSYNPMEGCVDGAYFGKSENGWINQELFYGCELLTAPFVPHYPTTRCGFLFFLSLESSMEKFSNGLQHPGETVSKVSFSSVFRKAYLQVVKPETIINAFKHSGIYPPNRNAIVERKLQPSRAYQRQEKTEPYQPVAAKKLALIALEEELDAEILKKCEHHLEEGYDCEVDPVYNTWRKLKQKCRGVPLGDLSKKKMSDCGQKDHF